nr:putative reverse transcriptase domain, ribonuclease H-like domain protein [Tanacetum cinerariifolium]
MPSSFKSIHNLAEKRLARKQVFAWARSEKTAIPQFFVEHQLKIYPLAEPMAYKRRPMASEGRLALKEKGDEEKTGFHTEEGVYCFTHMPKELKNLAATLQRMMEKVLADQRGRNMEIYLEEIVIKSKSELDLVQDVKETLRKLKRVNINIDPATSSFGVEEGRFLDHMVTKKGVKADLKKVQAI